MTDRLISAFVAVGLAVLIWLYARSRDQETLDHVPVPVDVVLGAGQVNEYGLEIVGQPQVLATFTGPPPRIRELRGLLQRDQLRIEVNFTVPADRLKENRLYETLLVEPSSVRTPPGITTMLVTGRNQVRIVLHRLGEKRLPVRLDTAGETPAVSLEVEPASVLVRGPLEVLERTSTLPTQPWFPPPETSRGNFDVRLVREVEGRRIRCEPEAVTVRIGTRPTRRTYDLADVPVHFLTPAGFPFRPRFANDRAGRITVRLTGSLLEEPPRVQAFVDLSGKGFADPAGLSSEKPRWFEEPVQVHCPPGFKLEASPGRSVSFELLPVADPPARLIDMTRDPMP